MVLKDKYAMLSFDVEEFDIPIEKGYNIPLSEQVKYSAEGLNIVIKLLRKYHIKATFFCTTNFALNANHIIKILIEDGHEIASHGCAHTYPQGKDIILSSQLLKEQFSVEIHGYRQPRMMPIKMDMIRDVYKYDASLNPTIIPGRYMNHNKPRRIFMSGTVVEIPSSVTPYLRIPLFWLSLHHLPFCIYMWLVRKVLKNDGYFNTYFHPWEFIDLNKIPYKIPYIIRHNTGREMKQRLSNLIEMLLKEQVQFVTYHRMTQIWINK
jgi:peptidoglycan/xylan/chitin deacetylase (PgdA/CDA1 family)